MTSTTTHVSAPNSALLVLGSTGRIGGMLRRYWSPSAGVTWQSRHENNNFTKIDIETDAENLVAAMRGKDAVLCLAGVTRAKDGGFAANISLPATAVRAAGVAGVRRVLIASSAAVYGTARSPLRETTACAPTGGYGRSKLEMERVAAALAAPLGVSVCALRIGNVAGADAILGGWRAGMQIDRFADGRTPRRSYVGPQTLAHILAALVDAPGLPPLLNVAAPGTVEMGALLDAAGRDWTPRRAAPGAIAEVALDTAGLARLVPLDRHWGQAGFLAAQAHDWQGRDRE